MKSGFKTTAKGRARGKGALIGGKISLGRMRRMSRREWRYPG